MVMRTSPALLADERSAHAQLGKAVDRAGRSRWAARPPRSRGAAPDVRRGEPAARTDQRRDRSRCPPGAPRRAACCTSRARRRTGDQPPAGARGAARPASRTARPDAQASRSASTSGARDRTAARPRSSPCPTPSRPAPSRPPPSSRAIRAVSTRQPAAHRVAGTRTSHGPPSYIEAMRVGQQRRQRRLVDVAPRRLEHHEVELVAVEAVAVAEGREHDHDGRRRKQHTPPGDRWRTCAGQRPSGPRP